MPPAGHFPTRLLACLPLVAVSCIRPLPPCGPGSATAGTSTSCPMPDEVDRSFDLEVPASWDGRSPLPLVVAFHGGGGNKESAAKVACPEGNADDARCLTVLAKAAGFAVVRPDGTGARPLRNIRTWNAGGGTGPFNCTSGGACKSAVDDVAYFDALLAEVSKVVPIDPKRVHLTGISNGAAISHRLACERPDRIASIVAVGGANQFARAGGACPGGVPVLQIHGTQDPCWSFEESDRSCLDEQGIKAGVMPSMEGWRIRNGCDGRTAEEPLEDRDPNDGTRAARIRWLGCRADVELIRIDGGGHTWPGGNPYFSEARIGRVSRDLGSDVVVEFFRAHPRQ